MADPIADLLAAHVFHPSIDVPGWRKADCTCGHVYDNPNASPFASHPQHVADVIRAYLTSDDMRERVADALINQGYEPYTYALDAAGRILAAITEGEQS